MPTATCANKAVAATARGAVAALLGHFARFYPICTWRLYMFALHHSRQLIPLALLLACACSGSKTNASFGSTLATVTEGASSCPAGGQVLTYGVDKNQNGVLDSPEVAGSFDICRGSNATLTQVVPIAAGEPCAFGGQLVKTGQDVNGNAILEDSEVSSQTPICGNGNQITTVIGNLQLAGAEDVAKYSQVETVSGYLFLDVAGMTGTATFPNLRSVGLYIRASNGIEDFFALNGCDNPTAHVNLSLPALISVQNFYSDYGIGVSAPVLAALSGEMGCNDPNAVLPALRSVSSLYSSCGTNLAGQMATATFDVYPRGPNAAFASTTSIGVGADPSGAPLWSGYGSLRLTDGSLQSVSFPLLTRVGYLEVRGMNRSASFSAPNLTTVGTVLFDDDGDTYQETTASFAVDAPQFTSVLGYAVEESGQQAAPWLQNLLTLGGPLQLQNTQETVLNANHLTQANALDVTSNDSLTAFALPNLRTLQARDANYDGLRLRPGSGNLQLSDCVYYGTYLPNLTHCSFITFDQDAQLARIDLGNVNAIPGGLYLRELPALTSLSGLASLTTLSGQWVAYNLAGPNGSQPSPVLSLLVQNTALTSLAAFSAVATLETGLAVVNNASLTALGGLQAVSSNGTCPYFYNNPQLDYCAVKNYMATAAPACSLLQNNADDPSYWQLKDPCANVTCQVGSCAVDCTQQAGYSCQ